MKKIFFTMIALLTITTGSFAQGLDPVVAKVTFTRTDIITLKDFKAKLAILEKLTNQPLAPDGKKELLQSMVKELVVLQAAEKNGLRVTEKEVMEYTRSVLRFQGTDEDLKKAVNTQLSMSWVQYLDAQKRTLIVQKFMQNNPKMADLQKITVTAKEIEDFFGKNKSQFMNPDMVRISHIFFDTKKNPKGSVGEIQKRAEDVQKQILAGQATFEEMVRKFSEDEGSKVNNGDIGFMPRSASTPQGQQVLSLFGDEFINGVFSVKKGETSKVIRSNIGLHIVRITDKLDQKFLNIDEPIAPLQKVTVREYIKGALTQQAQQTGLAKLIEEMVGTLMKDAKVELFEKNL